MSYNSQINISSNFHFNYGGDGGEIVLDPDDPDDPDNDDGVKGVSLEYQNAMKTITTTPTTSTPASGSENNNNDDDADADTNVNINSSSSNSNTNKTIDDADNDDYAINNPDTGVPFTQQTQTPETQKQRERERMNVVVLFPDDWRYNSIGSENPIIQTPFLDSLATEGIRFRQNAVTTSICWQSRATLFTGQWASRHRSYKLKCPHFARGKAWNQTWPELLKNDGYFVGHVGKWQYHSDNVGRFQWQNYFEGRHKFIVKKKEIAAEDLASQKAKLFLNDRPKDKPFAMTVAFYPPKPVGVSGVPGGQWMPKNETRKLYDNITIPDIPYNTTKAIESMPHFLRRYGSAARARWRKRYSTPLHYQEAMKNIYALITQVDNACKVIVEELKEQGVYNNTMIIFTTDNGMFHGAHGLAGKWYPYQESIRVPLIVYDPRMPKEKRGTVDDSFTLNVDLAETILGAAGLPPHERMQGRDMSDLYLPNWRTVPVPVPVSQTESGVKGETDSETETETAAKTETETETESETEKTVTKTALEIKPWRNEFFYEFTFLDENFIPSSNALVRKKWKLIDWYHYKQFQLFDLENDPMELNDVVYEPKNAEVVKEMKERLAQMKANFKEEDDIGCDMGEYGKNSMDWEELKEKERLDAQLLELIKKANATRMNNSSAMVN